MYEINTYTLEGDNFLAGDMKIAKEALPVAEDEEIAARSLIKLADGEAAAYTANDLEAETVPYGIAAADAEDGQVAVYLTGEFFGEKLALPDGVTADDVKPLLRENGIFLKTLDHRG